jgi:transposase
MKTFRPYAPRQGYLLPPSPQDWLPEGHLAYFILDLVAQLDLSRIYAYYEREERGFPPHHPQMMMALLLYGYCVGVPSSRKIERKTHEDVAFRVIAGDQHPDHTCVSEFRRIHHAVFADVFVEVLKICQEAGLVKLGHVALDGTKMKANASKHKAMSYERMKKQEAELAKKVDDLLRAADEADAVEDARYGKGKRGDELPEDLRRAETRIARIRAAKAALEAEANAQREAEEEKSDDDEPPAGGATPLPQHRIPRDAEGKPTPKAQRNFTDAESRIQKTGDGFVQGYNCQAAVDEGYQIIVAQAVTNQPPDVEHFTPMLEQAIANCGGAPEKITADAGYFSEQNVANAKTLGADPFIAPGRWKRDEVPVKVCGRPPANMTPKQTMARKLATRTGASVYARRKAVVEPIFGQIKQARGLRQFLLRGVAKVRAEWALITLTHNLLKLHAASA